MPRKKPELFNPALYPTLRRFATSERYGDMELLEVNETPDGFLIGFARVLIGAEGEHYHSVFLGAADDFRPASRRS